MYILKKKKSFFSVHENLRPHICPTCGKTFKLKQFLKNHLLIHENNGEGLSTTAKKKEYICEKCNKTFRDKSNLNCHIRGVHEGERNLVCTYCGKAFFQPHDLKRHVEMKHERPNLREYNCDICDKSYKTKEYLKLHKNSKILIFIINFFGCPMFHYFSSYFNSCS